MNMKTEFVFRKATAADLDEIAALYDSLCGYLNEHENYPHWEKGVYPTRSTAEMGIELGIQYVCLRDGRIAGTIRLCHVPEEGYRGAAWKTPDDYSRILVLYTFGIHPDFLGSGAGLFMLESVEKLARKEGCVSLRLDTVTGNIPAERLYLKAGYEYIETKSLGYEMYDLPWFDLYEKVLG